MQDEQQLRSLLRRIDGRGYKAYKDLRGDFDLGGPTLHVDHVQGDPFASPSKLRIRLPLELTRIPRSLVGKLAESGERTRRTALQDFLARRVRGTIAGQGGRRRGSGKSGVVRIDAGAQEVLERTALVVTEQAVEARLHVGLPAAGRRVLGSEALALLCEDLPAIARAAFTGIDEAEAEAFVRCVEDQEHLRGQLPEQGLVAFVGDGAVLPRESGASDRPLRSGAIAFTSPESLRVRLERADGAAITGMGVPRGITLVVGGGYHGKSTLLRALERGVYAHIPGDGRESVVSLPGLVKIRAEDGRRVEGVDIGAFIRDLPGGRSTHAFSSDDASGSTSQAANIVEALEVGASGLLLDEDTSATNFMVRDARMQALVHADHEPITPFLDRVRELYEEAGVSTVLVMGGCGDYFDVADTVVRMREFVAEDATAEARRIASEIGTSRVPERPAPLRAAPARIPLAEGFDASRGRREVKIDAREVDAIVYGREPIDLRGLEQLVDASQTRAIGHAIHLATERFVDGERSLAEILDALEALLEREGLDVLDPFHRAGQHPGDYARPRRFEIAGALNRLRTLRVRQRAVD